MTRSQKILDYSGAAYLAVYLGLMVLATLWSSQILADFSFVVLVAGMFSVTAAQHPYFNEE